MARYLSGYVRRGYDNVPDDWDSYWYKCDRCGQRYHASDGGCVCEEERDEEEPELEDAPEGEEEQDEEGGAEGKG